MQRIATLLVAGLVGVGLAGCGPSAGDGAAGASPSTSGPPGVTGDLIVLAAASLTESFTRIGAQFEAANPGVEVTFGFAGSSALAGQISSGAPADVFASASTTTMDAVVAAGDAADPRVFATNVMQIAVPPSNPGRVTGVDSLAGTDVKTALCQAQVPCGSAAVKVFANAGVTVQPVTLEPDVKSVLSKVQLGEVDAGMVYATDVLAAGTKVKGLAIPSAVNVSTSYPIAVLTASSHAATAAAFVDYVLSPEGSAVLAAAGFQRP